MTELAARVVRPGIPFVPAALVCIAAGAVLGWATPSPRTALIAAIASVCILPLAVRAVDGRFDLLEPIVPATFAFLVMYAAQPAALLLSGRAVDFKLRDITPQITPSLVAALVAVTAFQIGYALPWAARLAGRLPRAREAWDTHTTALFSLGLALLAVLLFALFLRHAGGLGALWDIARGRSLAQDAQFRTSSAYLYGAPALIWPASLLLFAAGLGRRRDFVVLSLLLMVPLAIFAGGRGDRIVLVPLLLAPPVYWCLARGRRPGTLAVALAAYLVLTVGVAFFRDTRSLDSPVSRTHELAVAVLHPTYELRQLVVQGVDNDMFQSLASELQIVPSQLAASPLDFAYRVAAKPVPSILWRNKPLGPEEHLTRALYPSERSRASSSSGVVGSFYLAGELPAVAIGMLLLGCLFRVPWEYFRRFPRASSAQVILTVALMFVPIALRGGLGETVVHAFFKLVPLLLAVRLCMRPAKEAS